MEARAFRLPVTVRLPLIAATMIFLAAVASTQTAIFLMGRQADRQVEALGQVYLDGLSTALLPHAVAQNSEGIAAALRQALAFHEGVVDRRLVFMDRRGGTAVEAWRSQSDAEQALPAQVGASTAGIRRTDDGTMWIWRPLSDSAGTYGTVVANLDISAFDAERGVLRWSLLLFDLLFSGVCAVIGFFMVRRIQRPVATVARHLYEAALGMLRPIRPQDVPAGDVQAERMIHAFNAMAHAAGEREGLLQHMSEQQRQADIGRLTATIAHEVRNPLGGMRTAVSTLRRFGDQEEPRQEAVDFLERGVAALQHVVDATLENYRGQREWRPLSRQDFADLCLLVEADGRSRDVSVVLDLDIPETVPVAALDVRQVLLNLLLNAVRASAKGGKVHLTAGLQGADLVIGVRDQGGGLDRDIASAIESGTVAADRPGLGVAVVIRLVERLHGKVAIESGSQTGTSITLTFPLQGRDASS